ncbi:hypothetical protein BaRGS_00010286 [Batillaria attramentaria]|uniref:Uncharacterized protein n=1 Tax=Batillaria attramentaria TaxID=370345 RepID=A0ABD0LGH7_9CAEN
MDFVLIRSANLSRSIKRFGFFLRRACPPASMQKTDHSHKPQVREPKKMVIALFRVIELMNTKSGQPPKRHSVPMKRKATNQDFDWCFIIIPNPPLKSRSS